MPNKPRLPQRGERLWLYLKPQQKAVTNYVKSNFGFTMQKGSPDTIKAHAGPRSESVSGFINRAIREAMERDNGVPGPPGGRREGHQEKE